MGLIASYRRSLELSISDNLFVPIFDLCSVKKINLLIGYFTPAVL